MLYTCSWGLALLEDDRIWIWKLARGSTQGPWSFEMFYPSSTLCSLLCGYENKVTSHMLSPEMDGIHSITPLHLPFLPFFYGVFCHSSEKRNKYSHHCTSVMNLPEGTSEEDSCWSPTPVPLNRFRIQDTAYVC